MSVRHGIDQALAPLSPAGAPHHVGGGPRLVQEHETSGVHVTLPHAPALSIPGNVGPILLGGSQRLFLCDRPRRRSIRRIVESAATRIPRAAKAA